MEVPKTLWLKKNMPSSAFSQCQFFDLPDWLTYRATDGCATRSACSLACKCSYVPELPYAEGQPGWQDQFFKHIGLGEFVENGYAQFGPIRDILTAGLPVGKGLGPRAAKELGLREGTPVGSAVIDAFVTLSWPSP